MLRSGPIRLWYWPASASNPHSNQPLLTPCEGDTKVLVTPKY